MFTGIIEEIGVLESFGSRDGGYRIKIRASKVLQGTQIGDSIAVNGVCLTAVYLDDRIFEADVMPETWRRSSLGKLKAGHQVNLERALTLASRLGGHLVSGHIDGTAVVSHIRNEGNSLWLTLRPEPHLLKYIAHKGSVALDGTSLTVAETEGDTFAVGLIPATQAMTTLSSRGIGDSVNVETDLIAKHIERLLAFPASGRKPLDMDYLKENGYA